MRISIKTKKRRLSSFNVRNKKKYPEYPILLYVNDRKKVYYLTTGLTTTDEYQDDERFADKYETPEMNQAKSKRLLNLVDDCRLWAEENPHESIEERKLSLQRLVNGEDMRVDKNLVYYMRTHMRMYKKAGTLKIWKRSVELVEEFGENAYLESVTSDWLRRFERYCMTVENLSINSTAQHLRNIKTTIMERIKKREITNNPFLDYQIKSEVSFKYVSLKAQALADLRDFECEEFQKKYRDIFMLSLYLGGINIVDLFGLTEIKDGWITFVRTKSDKRNKKNFIPVRVPVMPEAMEIINRYKGKTKLISLTERKGGHQTLGRRTNLRLKEIGLTKVVKDKVGKMRKHEHHPLSRGLCLQVARKTFSTMCAKSGVSERVCGLLMGHSWAAQNTTQIYQCIDDDDLYNGMRKVIDYMNSFKGRSKVEIFEEIRTRDGIE